MKAKPAALEPDLRHARWISKGLPVSITTSNIAAASAWFSHYASSLLFTLFSVIFFPGKLFPPLE